MSAVHSSLPDWKKATTSLAFRKLVWKKLRWGKKGALKGRQLSRLCGEKESTDNTKVRKALKELLLINKKPVMSCSKGYFKAETADEIRECRDDMFLPHFMASRRNMKTCNALIKKMERKKK